MFVAAAAVPRSVSRFALSSGSKSLAGRQHTAAVAAARSISSVFRPTPGVRKSAAVESPDYDDWDNNVPPASKINPACIVNSHTEWDPLEEVIVGRVDDATIPEWHVSGKAVWPAKHWDMYKNRVGESFPKDLVSKGTGELMCTTEVLTCLCRRNTASLSNLRKPPDILSALARTTAREALASLPVCKATHRAFSILTEFNTVCALTVRMTSYMHPVDLDPIQRRKSSTTSHTFLRWRASPCEGPRCARETSIDLSVRQTLSPRHSSTPLCRGIFSLW